MSTPAPDWYPDPDDPTQLRYWDGNIWTENRAPAPGTAEQPQAPERSEGRGIEDVAWAGVAAAAEAATIGVRLANRALEAMRDAVDRR